MFRGYLNEEARYRKCFAGDWYLTGDLAKRDADGYFWFVGRADDVIKSSGHLIGPFEVESAFMEHPAVAEAGRHRQTRRSPAKSSRLSCAEAGHTADDELRANCWRSHASALGAAVAPKEIEFRDALP
jgi:acetyl-CoA synthetase